MPDRKALIVAIDNYLDPRNNLNSCIADARAMAEILRSQYGFTSTMLLDEEATVPAVDAALDALLRGATAEDRLVFFYSGHGYRYQEGERRIEVLVMHDAQFFADFRLSQKTQALPDGVLTVITDCCHAGGMDKFLVAGPGGFELALPKVWNPTLEQVQRENRELARARRIVFKGFGREPTVLPIAVAKEFGYPEPPAATKSLALAASRVTARGGRAATTDAGRPGMVPAAIQPGLSPALAKSVVLGPGAGARGAAQPGVGRGAGARGAAAQPDRCATPGVEVVTALDDIAVVDTERGAAEPGAGKALGDPETDGIAGLAGGNVLPGQLQLKGVLLAASLAHETASAKTNETEGLSAFTFGIRKVLRENGFDLPATELMSSVAATLHSMGFRQTPILHEPEGLRFRLGSLPLILMPREGALGTGAATGTTAGLTRDTAGEGTTMAKPFEEGGRGAGMEGALTGAAGAGDAGAGMLAGGIRLSEDHVKGLFDTLIRIAPRLVGTIASALSKSIAAGPEAIEKGLEDEAGIVMTGDQVKGFMSLVMRHGPRVLGAVLDALSKGTPVIAGEPGGGRFTPPEEAELTMTAGELKGFMSFVRRVARRAAPVVGAVARGVINALGKELQAGGAPKGEDAVAITLTEGQAKGLFDLVRLVLSQIPRGKAFDEAEVAEPELTTEQAKGWLQLLSLVPDLAMQAVDALSKAPVMGMPAPEAAPKGLTTPGEARRGTAAEATAIERGAGMAGGTACPPEAAAPKGVTVTETATRPETAAGAVPEAVSEEAGEAAWLEKSLAAAGVRR